MSDTSLLPESPILEPALDLKASALDSNLRSIRQVESSWRLPELPDEVRLDLATNQSIGSQNLASFLYGLDRDVHGENDEDLSSTFDVPEIPVLSVRSLNGFSDLELSTFQRTASMVSTLRGMKPTEVLDADAVQHWKLRAIEKGYMEAPADGVVDGSWSPELNGLRSQIAYEEYDERLRGDRFGALQIAGKGGVLELINDWTSPTGLLRAAMDLDLVWDPGAISKEWSSWGDKWRNVGKSKNPLDFAKNLFDAMTGPIDDVVMPVINIALLASGVGAGFNTARLAATGLRSAQEASAAFRFAAGLYRAPAAVASRIFPSVDGAVAAAKMGQASMLANRLQKGGSAASAVGRGMAAWRELPGVINAKRTVQAGMRLGVVSQAEDLLPGYQGGLSLADTGAGEQFDKFITTGAGMGISTGFEWMFTPYRIFEPGTLVGNARAVRDAGFAFLGSTPGRALTGAVLGAGVGAIAGDDTETMLAGGLVGATGAAVAPDLGRAAVKLAGERGNTASKLVGRFGDVTKLGSWAPMSQNQRVTAVFVDAVKSKLSPDEWRTFEEGIARDGFITTFAKHIGTDEVGANQAMAYTMVSAAIDNTAAQQAKLGGTKGARARYWLFRNKLNAQLRTFDPTTTTKEEIVLAMTQRETVSNRGLKARFEQNMVKYDDTALAELVALHNDQADLTLRQLLSNENMPLAGLDDVSRTNLSAGIGGQKAGAMQTYIANALDSFGNWGPYSTGTSGLRDLVGAGIFDEVRILGAKSQFGRKLNILDYMAENQDTVTDDMVDWAAPLNDAIAGGADEAAEVVPGLVVNEGGAPPRPGVKETFHIGDKTLAQWRKQGGFYNPLAREVDPTRGRFTLARKGTKTKQQYIEAADEIDAIFDVIDSWRKVSRIETSVGGVSLAASGQIGKMNQFEANQLVKALALKENDAKALRRLNRLTRSLGLDVDEAFDSTLRAYLDDVANDARWTDEFGQDAVMYSKADSGERVATSGRDLLKQRQKALREEANWAAADVDTEDLIAKLEAAGRTEEATRLKAMLELADSSGYKVVYGHDFLGPDELLNRTGMFEDVNARHMNAVTLGNFFGRKHPEALALKVQRYRTMAISRELAKARGVDSLDPDDEEVRLLIQDLYEHVLDPELALNKNMTDDVRHMAWTGKRGTALHNMNQPRSLQDLGLGRNRKRVMAKLTQLGWSERDAAAAWQGLKASRFADWKDQGLYAMEAKLRGRNQILDGLRFLSGTDEGLKLQRRGALGVAPGAAIGAVMAQSHSDEEDVPLSTKLAGAAIGAVGGVLAGAGVSRVAGKAADAFDFSGWARYGYVADNLAAFRDKMRFSLSPFFDLSRYTEAFTLNQIAAPAVGPDGKRIVMPLNTSPAKLRKTIGEAKFGQVVAELRAASGGKLDPIELDTADRWFSEIGILGFNPTNWMASTFHHLRQAGLSADESWQHVNRMYHYGTSGRSAAEMSTNFIFFPFSFQKKTLTHAAEFLGDDLMRSVLLHDTYSAYQFLDERYDLDRWAEDHLPILEKLQQLNMFAFGVSPGKLGGVNAPFVDFLVGDPTNRDPHKRGLVFNLFNPQAVLIPSDPDGRGQFEQLVRRSLPIINDLQHMLEDGMDQAYVLRNGQTKRADINAGYKEWNEYKVGIEAAMQRAGVSWHDLYNDPGLQPALNDYLTKRNEIELKYPAWVESKNASIARTNELQQEARIRIETLMFHPEQATAGDRQFVQMERLLGNLSDQDSGDAEPGLKQMMAERGITSVYDYPPSELDRIRGVAVAMAQGPDGQAFEMIWKKFYEKTFGPITTVAY